MCQWVIDMDIEVLEHYAEVFNKQKVRKFPCSNQIVVCGIVTYDREKAILIMNKKGATVISQSRHRIEWKLNNERWIWRIWNDGCRGYRFYKIVVDKDIGYDLLKNMILPCSDLYCCSFEII